MSDVTRGMTNRDTRKVVREAIKAGCGVSITGGNHIRIDTPQGPYFTGLTTSDQRAHLNLRRDLRRRGVAI